MSQLQLFTSKPSYPEGFIELLNRPETTLAISTSGGKDSVAMTDYLKQQQYQCHCICIHAELGAMEWSGTHSYIAQFCAERNLDLVTVKAKKSLFRYILERMNKLGGGVFWMSSKARYCTSYMKKAPINKYLRRYKTVINAVGIRAEESPHRHQQQPYRLNKELCSKHYLNLSIKDAIALHITKPKGRLVIDWYPVFNWSRNRVWEQLGHSEWEWQQRRLETDDSKSANGWKFHYAYVIGKYGNTRLSCCFCMMGKKKDLINAIPYNPIAYRFIKNLEQKTRISFQPKTFLSQLLQK